MSANLSVKGIQVYCQDYEVHKTQAPSRSILCKKASRSVKIVETLLNMQSNYSFIGDCMF